MYPEARPILRLNMHTFLAETQIDGLPLHSLTWVSIRGRQDTLARKLERNTDGTQRIRRLTVRTLTQRLLAIHMKAT